MFQRNEYWFADENMRHIDSAGSHKPRGLGRKVPRIDPAAQGDDQTRSAVAAGMRRRRRWLVNANVIMARSIWETAGRRQWPPSAMLQD
jgi:hypothetical protein